MRSLSLTKRPADPSWPADQARALPLLHSLAAEQPLPLAPADAERLLRFIVAMATQYRGQGASWETLLTAGFNAAAECLARPGREADYLAWWVRQGMTKFN